MNPNIFPSYHDLLAAEFPAPAKRARNRNDGRFTFDGRFERLCRCGHKLGVHRAEAPHDCDTCESNGGECAKFRPVRK